MKKKRIYIDGCGGMLGDAFYEVFQGKYETKCTDKNVTSPWLSYMDFRDFEAFNKDVEDFHPDYLFHLGAYTDLEWCENNVDETYRTNALCVENAVRLANKLDIPILYISTAGIFDGKKPIYDDYDIPNPTDTYARAKYAGERYVVENAKRYVVCRAGWMMGGGPNKDKKFVQKIMKQIKDGQTTLHVVDDKDGTPTYTVDFAKTCKNIIENEYWGLYNCACNGETSRLEVCREMLNILGLEDKIKIEAVHSDYFAKEYFANRPNCERLDDRKLRILGVSAMRDWKVSLKEYLNKDYKNYI